jgi:hypothetical protein
MKPSWVVRAGLISLVVCGSLRAQSQAQKPYVLKDIAPGTGSSTPHAGKEALGTVHVTSGSDGLEESLLFFAGDIDEGDVALWKSGGTPGTTTKVSGDLGGICLEVKFSCEYYPTGLTVGAGGALFANWDPEHGVELWTTDFTPQEPTSSRHQPRPATHARLHVLRPGFIHRRQAGRVHRR